MTSARPAWRHTVCRDKHVSVASRLEPRLGESMMNRKELTTPLGFFNYALSYRAAADKLRICKLRATHPHAPVLFIYYHSVELYLKAFLRAHGLSVAVRCPCRAVLTRFSSDALCCGAFGRSWHVASFR